MDFKVYARSFECCHDCTDSTQPSKGLSWYVWVVMAIAFIWLVLSCFDAGVKDAKSQDARILAHIEAMKAPLDYSLPEHFLEMTGERVDITKGEK